MVQSDRPVAHYTRQQLAITHKYEISPDIKTLAISNKRTLQNWPWLSCAVQIELQMHLMSSEQNTEVENDLRVKDKEK